MHPEQESSAKPGPGGASPWRAEALDGKARAGVLSTAHGEVQTPTFMAVGTHGSVKALLPYQVKEAGTGIVLANTYHMLVRPGPDIVADLGGLHQMTGWSGPMLTDSGGFQVFSLASRVKTKEDGVTFASHVDGAKISLTPESCMEVQGKLGADIIMQLDDVPELPATPEREIESMTRSLRWAKRARAAFEARAGKSAQGHQQLLFGIQQGGLNAELRQQSIDGLKEVGFDGYAVGGLSVGETKPEMHKGMHDFAPMLPSDRPRYVMGVGFPEDILEAVAAGVDMMDCVLPTRVARHGLALTSRGRVNLKNQRHERDLSPIDPKCKCHACTNFSRGYLRHMVRQEEIVGNTLITLHNLTYYATLMREAREAIVEERFQAFYDETQEGWRKGALEEGRA